MKRNLEDAFNRIMALETMLKDLKTAVDENNQEEIKDITDAVFIFMFVYVQQYSKKSMRNMEQDSSSNHTRT